MTPSGCIYTVNPAMKSRFSSFRNPPFAGRVFLVAAVSAIPRFLTGGIVSLLLGGFLICFLTGALIFALAEAAMEAWPNQPYTICSTSRAHDRPTPTSQALRARLGG